MPSFMTQFSLGQRVRRRRQAESLPLKRPEPAFMVGQIRIETLKGGGCLIEYRANYKTGRNGSWIAERYLKNAEESQ